MAETADSTAAMGESTESVESLTGRPAIEPALATVWTHKQAAIDKRAPLRIYLGAAPGVGKTYAMLSEGQRRRERGSEVVVGIETYERPKTQEILEGLEVVPPGRSSIGESRSKRWTPARSSGDELLARVRALLRRSEERSVLVPPHFVLDDLEIDMGQRRVARAGQAVRLTKTEWALLEAFAGHPGKLLTHGWLLGHVWGPGYADDVDVLRVFVSQLRKKIESDPTLPAIIVTEPGVGYRWVLRAEPAEGGSPPT